MRRIALVLLAATCISVGLMVHGSAMAQTGSSAAAFSVTPIKNAVTQGEAVQLLLQLRNLGQTTLIVDGNLAMGNSVHPSVTDPQGKKIDWSASFNSAQPAFETLAPGGSLTRILCLNCGIQDPFNNPFEQTGTYTVQMEYSLAAATTQASNFPNAVPLSQTLVANSFHFQISPASVVFTAQPAQPVFHAGEPVSFDFRLQNRASQAVLAAYDLSLGNAIQLRVVDGNGKEVAWSGRAIASTPMLATVSAGKAIDSTYPITPTNRFGTTVAGCDIREPGTYTAYAAYMISETFNVLHAYVDLLPILIVPGPIEAPPVKFTVAAAGTGSSTNQ